MKTWWLEISDCQLSVNQTRDIELKVELVDSDRSGLLDLSRVEEIGIAFSCMPTFQRHTGETYKVPNWSDSWSATGKFVGWTFRGTSEWDYSGNKGKLEMKGNVSPDRQVTSFMVRRTENVGPTTYDVLLRVNEPISLPDIRTEMSGTTVTGKTWSGRVEGPGTKGYVAEFNYIVNPGPDETKVISFETTVEHGSLSIWLFEAATGQEHIP